MNPRINYIVEGGVWSWPYRGVDTGSLTSAHSQPPEFAHHITKAMQAAAQDSVQNIPNKPYISSLQSGSFHIKQTAHPAWQPTLPST